MPARKLRFGRRAEVIGRAHATRSATTPRAESPKLPECLEKYAVVVSVHARLHEDAAPYAQIVPHGQVVA